VAPRTTARPRPEFATNTINDKWPWVVALVVAVAVVALVSRLDANPAVVGRVAIENNTEYALNVEVTDGGHTGWLQVGTVDQRATMVVSDVIDQGTTWVFHLTGQGEDGGEIQVTRSELAANGWRFTVPTKVSDALRAAGAPPTP
jgi:hypothetical protein